MQCFSLPLGLACLPSSKALGLGCQLCEAAELRAAVCLGVKAVQTRGVRRLPKQEAGGCSGIAALLSLGTLLAAWSGLSPLLLATVMGEMRNAALPRLRFRVTARPPGSQAIWEPPALTGPHPQCDALAGGSLWSYPVTSSGQISICSARSQHPLCCLYISFSFGEFQTLPSPKLFRETTLPLPRRDWPCFSLKKRKPKPRREAPRQGLLHPTQALAWAGESSTPSYMHNKLRS